MASREEKKLLYTDVIRFICNLETHRLQVWTMSLAMVNWYKVLIHMDLNFINVC
jgi:hypothetical protein